MGLSFYAEVRRFGLLPLGVYILVVGPIWALLAWASINFQTCEYAYGCDYWEHTAALNAWLKDFKNPGNPHLLSDEGSSRYMPFYAFITLVSRILNFDALQAIRLAGFFNINLFFVAAPLFANRYFRTPYAGVIAVTLLLCGWGVGWFWSNLYQLRDLLFINAYPSSFAFSCAFVVFWIAVGILRRRHTNLLTYLLLILLVSAIYASHPPTGVFVICSLGLMTVFEPEVRIGNRVYLLTSICAGALMVELWPFFSTWDVVLGVRNDAKVNRSWIQSEHSVATDFSRAKSLSRTSFYNPKDVLTTLGPALLGLPLILYLAYLRKHLFIISGLLVMVTPWLLNLFIKIPLGERFLFFAVFFLHLAMIWFVVDIMRSTENLTLGRRLWRIFGISVLALCWIWNMGLTVAELKGIRVTTDHQVKYFDYPNHSIPEIMKLVSELIPDSAVVMAPAIVGWPLPTFTGKVISTLHDNPLVADDKRRREDTDRFFTGRSIIMSKKALLKKYDVTHVFFNRLWVPAKVKVQLRYIPGARIEFGDYVIISLEKGDV